MGKRKRCETPPLTLPAELLEIIVHLACQSSSEDHGLADIDFRTTLSVALVSKHFYRFSHHLLYAHVRLTKPSDLVLYARTAATRPDLTRHTQSLWMGPDQTPVESRENWPLNEDNTGMKSSTLDPLKLPIGVDVGTCWLFAAGLPLATEEWIAEAARDVIREACRRVRREEHLRDKRGVSLRRGGTVSFDGRGLSYHEGRRRVYQVQHILDAFLEGVRKRQNLLCSSQTTHCNTGGLSSKGPHEPAPQPNVPSASASHGYSSSRPLRMYNVFDHFDHPMVYIRTNDYTSPCRGDWEIIKSSVTGELEYSIVIRDDPYACEASEESDSSAGNSPADGSDWPRGRNSSDDCSTSPADDCSMDQDTPDDCESDDDHSATAIEPEIFFSSDHIDDWFLNLFEIIRTEVDKGKPTVGALQVLARIILARSPKVVCLALTSYLQKVASGYEYGPVVKRLQLLTLGPPGSGYEGAMRFGYRGLASVRKLRLWGPEPHGEVAWTIDEANALPMLESLECTWTAPWVDPFESGMGLFALVAETHTVAAIERLLGFRTGKARRKKTFELAVWAHHERVRQFEVFASEEVRNHPRLKIERLPFEFEDEENGEPLSRRLALARIRKQWEAESQEILGTK